MNTLKQDFNKWLIKQDNPMLNKLGLDSIVSKLTDDLEIASDCSDIEIDVLTLLVNLFKQGPDLECCELNSKLSLIF